MSDKFTRVITSPWTFVIAVMTIGPFALPLLWRNPRYSQRTKIVVTIGVIALTAGLTLFLGFLTSHYLKAMETLMDGSV